MLLTHGPTMTVLCASDACRSTSSALPAHVGAVTHHDPNNDISQKAIYHWLGCVFCFLCVIDRALLASTATLTLYDHNRCISREVKCHWLEYVMFCLCVIEIKCSASAHCTTNTSRPQCLHESSINLSLVGFAIGPRAMSVCNRNQLLC